MKPKIFIGSSVEALDVAYAIQDNLEYDANVTVWSQGIFQLSSTALDDLIQALNNFDFGIFVFQPDDVTNMRRSSMNTVRDNVIFELGLFIGRLGKEKVYFVTPRETPNLHLPTDLLGVTAGHYDSNRDDGNIKAALGPFSNQVRIRLKKYTYENLNDLAHESPGAKKIAIEKPKYWEYLLAAELLSTKLVNINQSYDELENGLVFSKTKTYTVQEFGLWFSDCVGDLQKLVSILEILLTKELPECFGPPGVPGKVLDIKVTTDRLISFSKELLAWEYRIQEANPPEALTEIKEIMVGWSKGLFNLINKIPSELHKVINARKVGDSELSMNLTITPMSNLEKALDIYRTYVQSHTS